MMIELKPGHLYELANLKGEGTTPLQFYQDARIHGEGVAGPSTQEVIRACIARVKHLDSELPWEGNARIVEHLRNALVGFEVRALLRRVEKGEAIENLKTFANGHLIR